MNFSSPNLSRRLLRRILLVTGGASLVLGLVFVLLYRAEREEAHRHTAMLLNRTLQMIEKVTVDAGAVKLSLGTPSVSVETLSRAG